MHHEVELRNIDIESLKKGVMPASMQGTRTQPQGRHSATLGAVAVVRELSAVAVLHLGVAVLQELSAVRCRPRSVRVVECF